MDYRISIMAESPAHKFGQIIGNLLEAVVGPLLLEYCNKNNLYLDKAGPRSVRKGKKVSWMDKYGNTHDLDFVIEKNGTDKKTGKPVAFIESAWRRYTKHSRNKAQEIQGALLPLAETYRECNPFLGVILGGVFTDGALSQLKSHGFSVLYFEYDKILKAFSDINLDIFFDETTSFDLIKKKIKHLDRLSKVQYREVVQSLIKENQREINIFFKQIDSYILRKVQSVKILSVYGQWQNYRDIKGAIKAIEKPSLLPPPDEMKFIKFEIVINFNNKDKVEGQFSSQKEAMRFLHFFSDTENSN